LQVSEAIKILNYGGVLSFPLYLLHQDIGFILIGSSKSVPPWVGITLTCVIVIFLAVVVNMAVDCYQPKLREWISATLLKRFYPNNK
jgi:peptidoglycan/LPS O-acetylase OafA/YrhL